MRRILIACCFVLFPTLAIAQTPATPPESLLAENTSLYFRFDGIEPHRAAYERTAFGDLMRGEVGAFIDYVGKVITQQMSQLVLKDRPQGGAVPMHVLQLQNAYGQLPQLLDCCNRHGLLAGVELLDLENYRTQLTIVFPGATARKDRDALFAFFNLVPSLLELKVK